MHCEKSVQIRFFWSVVSCIRAEYIDLRSKEIDPKGFEEICLFEEL